MITQKPTTLFVANLSFELGEEELAALFTGIGAHVITATIALDRFTGQSRGFGFVEIDLTDDVANVIAKVDGMIVRTRSIHVEVANPRVRNSDQTRRECDGECFSELRETTKQTPWAFASGRERYDECEFGLEISNMGSRNVNCRTRSGNTFP
jgi:cold-inducible RNA-binding protein